MALLLVASCNTLTLHNLCQDCMLSLYIGTFKGSLRNLIVIGEDLY